MELPGDITSQFLSGLLMAGPMMPEGVHVELTSPLVSVPYVEMTKVVMMSFGVEATGLGTGPGVYRPANYHVEPDASAASYFFAAAAITGGRVTVEGLGSDSLQGDVRFVDVLEEMGARVERSARATTLFGPPLSTSGEPGLKGVEINMSDISDTAQTLAAVAVFAATPTRVKGIGFIRRKETDRIGALCAELRRAGIMAVEEEDGFTVHPGQPKPTSFATYDDHRMAMSLSLIGLRVPGTEITGPNCVAKTYPGFFEDLARFMGVETPPRQ